MITKLHSVYVFVGEEELLKEEALSELKQKCFADESALAFNYMSFDGESATSKQAVSDAQQLPFTQPLCTGAGFMNTKRMVVVKKAEHLLDDTLLRYIQNPAETTCLVLLMRKIDKRLSSYHILKANSKLVEYTHLKQQNLASWIERYMHNNGKNISHNNAVYISNILENNLSGIQQELEKLISYVGQRKAITHGDIEHCVSENKIRDSFELTDAIQQKDTRRAIGLVNNLLVQGRSLPEIIGLLRWMLTRLWQGKELINNKRRSDISRELRIPNYFLSKFINQAEKFSIPELKNGLNTLLNLEKTMRTYTLPQRLLLECLVIQLAESSLNAQTATN